MGLIDGTLKSGMVQYAYQLYNKHGIATDISPTTNLIPIINKNTLSGYAEGKTTNCGVRVGTIYQTENGCFDRVRIYRIHYTENGQLPTIEIIEDCNINSFDIDPSYDTETYNIFIEDCGQSALSTITLEEFNSLSGVHIIPKVIEDKNDYLFAAAIKDVQQSSFNGIENVTLSYEFVTLDLIGDASKSEVIGIPDHNTIQRKSNDSAWEISPNDFDLKTTITSYENSNFTYSSPIISYYAKSLRRGETYRFGVVFYNDKGESSGVVQSTITDVETFGTKFDNEVQKDAFDCYNTDEHYELLIHPVGVKFIINNIPEEAVAYEIVRCRRTASDIRNIS